MLFSRPARAFMALLVCVFLATAIADIVIVIYTRALANRAETLAISMAVCIGLTKSVGLVLTTSQPDMRRRWVLQVVSALGMGCGTWIGLLLY